MSTSSSNKNTGSRAGNTGQAQQRPSKPQSQQQAQQRYRQIQEEKVKTAIKISDARNKAKNRIDAKNNPLWVIYILSSLLLSYLLYTFLFAPSKSTTLKSSPPPKPSSKPVLNTPSTAKNDLPFEWEWPEWAPPASKIGALLPKVDDSSKLKIQADEEKREEIREALAHSWKAYEQNAWGSDEYHPISQVGSNLTQSGLGMGYMIVDSLDSLILMGFDEEYERARDWVRELSFDVPGKVNGFEVIIRILGGLLSAYHLTLTHHNPSYHSDSDIFLSKALDLADRLLPLFDTPSGIPLSFIDLHLREAYPDTDNYGFSSLAEAGTVQLEFKYLSWISGEDVYGEVAERVIEVLRGEMAIEGVGPVLINPENGKFVKYDIRLGSRGDSYYEYLLKQWIQTNRTEPAYREMYDQSMKGIEKLLMNRSPRQGLVYTQELVPQRDQTGGSGWRIVPKQDHLACFLGGSLLLGITSSYPSHKPVWSHLTGSQLLDYVAGTGIVETCVDGYESTGTGLAPEIIMFWWKEEMKGQEGGRDWYIKRGGIDGRNILRPETIESLFLAYRTTGEAKYRAQGWRMFEAFRDHCRVREGGYAGVTHVDEPGRLGRIDKMETFWISETLKYFYLLFSDEETIPLDRYVFNTEAHILPVFTPTVFSKFGQSTRFS